MWSEDMNLRRICCVLFQAWLKFIGLSVCFGRGKTRIQEQGFRFLSGSENCLNCGFQSGSRQGLFGTTSFHQEMFGKLKKHAVSLAPLEPNLAGFPIV